MHIGSSSNVYLNVRTNIFRMNQPGKTLLERIKDFQYPLYKSEKNVFIY